MSVRAHWEKGRGWLLIFPLIKYSKTCTICRKKRRVLKFFRSNFISDLKYAIMSERVINDLERIQFLEFPVFINEWVLPIHYNHNWLEITEEKMSIATGKALNFLIKKGFKIMTFQKNYIAYGTLSHPQFRFYDLEPWIPLSISDGYSIKFDLNQRNALNEVTEILLSLLNKQKIQIHLYYEEPEIYLYIRTNNIRFPWPISAFEVIGYNIIMEDSL